MSTLTLDSVRVSFSCFLLDISGVLQTRNASMFIVKHLFSRDWKGLLHQNTLLSWAGLARQICCRNNYLVYGKVHSWKLHPFRSLRARKASYGFQLCQFLAVRPWTSHFTSLSFDLMDNGIATNAATKVSSMAKINGSGNQRCTNRTQNFIISLLFWFEPAKLTLISQISD